MGSLCVNIVGRIGDLEKKASFQTGILNYAVSGNLNQYGLINIRGSGPWYLRISPFFGKLRTVREPEDKCLFGRMIERGKDRYEIGWVRNSLEISHLDFDSLVKVSDESSLNPSDVNDIVHGSFIVDSTVISFSFFPFLLRYFFVPSTREWNQCYCHLTA